MPRMKVIPLIALLAMIVSPAGAQTTRQAREGTKPPPVVQSFIATGSTSDADLARLRAALEKVVGVVTVDVRKGIHGASLTVKGDVLYTVLNEAANPLGYAVQLTPVRFFAANGPNGDSELATLRAAVQKVPGVDKVELSPITNGAAVRVSGIAEYTPLVSAAKTAGFAIRQMSSYAASGSSKTTDLTQLRSALEKVPGVEQIEMQSMIGGATVLIYGDVNNPALTKAGRALGYDIWSLGNAASPRAEYRVTGADDETKRQKLREVIQGLEGIDEFQINEAADGPRLVVSGERLKTDRIAAAAAEAGFGLSMLDNVSLPTLTPKAGRTAPADYVNAIVEDPLTPGAPAPAFSLLSGDGKNKISLADYRDKRPVVLLFGSCT